MSGTGVGSVRNSFSLGSNRLVFSRHEYFNFLESSALLLNDTDIRAAQLAGDISFGESFSYRQIQSSSVDLSAGRIYLPGSVNEANKAQKFSDLAVGQCTLEAGEAIVIELAEEVRIGNGFGGILMPPNSLAKNGIIMTNPGHIDPGYSGKLTVCLINMGKLAFSIEQNLTVATLLLFKLSSTSGGYKGEPGVGVGLTQLSKLSTDFANISERSYSYIKKAIWGHLATALGIISLAVAVLALLVPSLVTVLTGALEAKYSESQNGESIKRLESQIKALQSKLSEKDPATLGSQQQHTKRLSDESL
ncbi:dCTP deaminase [Pseudomonas aeruginosa]|uniref:dCTP deaminase n=1 Tax=Pseudomonas aeruginosa TaxID=287 RepID=UPI001F4B65CA|nr:hypothetical protein [Pseudomonas aeruginosa]MDN3871518.1 hypothetical protein [Pseudomonas aeruginosa]HCP6276733.1 hypothetical protein [Pseudomonas aeruginosa]